MPSVRLLLTVLCLLLAPLTGTALATPAPSQAQSGLPTDSPVSTLNQVANGSPEPSNISRDDVAGKDKSVAHEFGNPGLSSTTEVVIVTNGTTAERLSALEAHGVDVDLRHRNQIQATVAPESVDSLRELPFVLDIRPVRRPTEAVVSEGVTTVQADDAQALGVSGRNVTIGVIDSGFNVTHSEIAPNIEGYRSFTGDISNGGRSGHGTAVAEIVVDTAPNATLYLTNVRTVVEFAKAVDWLESKDVDVITTSIGWVGISQGGESLPARAASEAASNGTIFINAAGNQAETHWEDESVDTEPGELVEFSDDGTTINALNEGNQTSGFVDIRLSWDAWPTTREDYDLYLLNSSGSVIASSIRNQSGQNLTPTESIAGTLPRSDTYYVAIKNYDASTEHSLELTTDASPLRYRTLNGSIIPPATGRNVTAVGAFNFGSGSMEPFSSRGPTNDGRKGLNLVGPDGVSTASFGQESFYGTSASAPHVAGIAALLLADNRSFRAIDLVRTMENSATDIEQPGFDYTSGYGKVNALAALQESNPHAEDFSFKDSAVAVNETVTIETIVSNTVDQSGSETLVLYVDGRRQASQTVNLNATETKTVGFDHTFSTTGSHTVRVSYLQPVAVDVVASSEPAFEFDYRVENTSPHVGENVSLNATVRNTGGQAGSTTVRFYADGTAFATRNVTVAAGSNTTARASTSFAEPGNHTVSVNDEPPQNVTVHRRQVQLELSANVTTTQAGGAIRFDLRRNDDGTGVNGTIILDARRFTTGSDGQVTVRLNASGEFVAIGTKDPTATTRFTNDSLTVTVGEGSSNGSNSTADTRSLSSSTVPPGGEVTVTLRETADTSRIAFTEAIDPAIEEIAFVGLTINGEAATGLSPVVFESGLAVPINDVPLGANVSVRYTIGIPENASVGDSYTISGEVTDEATRTIENDVLSVVAGSPLSGAAADADTNQDGKISDAELSVAISEWASGEYSDAELSVIITAWAAS